jgi:4-hydroxy-tetrahydrodipicolinate reductase
MGQLLVRCLLTPPEPARERDPLVLTAALGSAKNAHLGHDVGPLCGAPVCGVEVTSDLLLALPLCDVVIDFSSPAATALLLPAAVAARVPVVIGTTGLSPATRAALTTAAAEIPLVVSANMSPGVNVLLGLLRQASAALADYDAEIFELHHRHKRDAPSGTALLLAEAIKTGRGEPTLQLRSGREGQVGPRERSELGVLAARGGDVVGEHTVMLLGTGERLELVHRATSREVFAHGALRAARWLVAGEPSRVPGTRPGPGLYDMEDVLGLK